ncbi:hypothetical protein [Natronospora cellulosivora (SeqCode)]
MIKKIPLKSYSEGEFKNFTEYFQIIIDEYYKKQESLDILNDEEIELLKNTSDSLILIIKKYLDGFSGEAYKEFVKMMKPLKKRFLYLTDRTYNSEYVKKIKENIDNININNTSVYKIKELLIKEIDILINDSSLDELYRLRIKNEGENDFEKMDLFHIPFDSYTKIKSYRYSIAGYPCLYLGTSFEVCYEEIRNPKIENVWMMKYKLKEDIMYIDLTKRPIKSYNIFKKLVNFNKKIKKEEQKNLNVILGALNRKTRRKIDAKNNTKFKNFSKKKNLILNSQIRSQEKIKILNEICTYYTPNKYLCVKKDLKKMSKIIDVLDDFIISKHTELKNLFLIYPLQLATSIKINDNDIFFPEYIISQFLMQWVRINSEFYCIKYISTRINENKNHKDYCNFVFPARSKKNKYCKELLKIFEIYEPIRAIDKIKL